MITLQVAMRFVGNYALRGLSPQTDGMPVIHKNKGGQLSPLFYYLLYPITIVIKFMCLAIYNLLTGYHIALRIKVKPIVIVF